MRVRVALMCVVMFVLMTATASAAPRQPKIINGSIMTQPDFDDRWSGMVQIYYADDAASSPRDGFTCGGMLISTRLVLTAGHCVSYDAPDRFRVMTGKRLLNDDPTGSIAVQDIIRYPGWVVSGFNVNGDIAVMRLASAATAGTPMDVVGAGDTAWWGNGAGLPNGAEIAGWGVMDEALWNIPVQLRTAAVPIQSDAACAATDPGLFYDATSMICLGSGDTNSNPATTDAVTACNGDSGSPVLVPDNPVTPTAWKIAGVASFGINGCSNGPTVYTRADAFRTWLASISDTDGGAGGIMPPTALATGASTLHSVSMTWTAPATGPAATRYLVFEEITIEEEGTYVSRVFTTTTPAFTVRQLSPLGVLEDSGISMRYWVASVAADGNASPYAGPLTPTTLADTESPTRVPAPAARKRGRTSIKLAWAPATDNDAVFNYVIEWRLPGSSSWNVQGGDGSTTGRISDLKPRHTYIVRIKAIDQTGNASLGYKRTVKTRP